MRNKYFQQIEVTNIVDVSIISSPPNVRYVKMRIKYFQEIEVHMYLSRNIIESSIISSLPNVRYIKMSESSQPHNGILYECADSQAGNLVTPLQPRAP